MQCERALAFEQPNEMSNFFSLETNLYEERNKFQMFGKIQMNLNRISCQIRNTEVFALHLDGRPRVQICTFFQSPNSIDCLFGPYNRYIMHILHVRRTLLMKSLNLWTSSGPPLWNVCWNRPCCALIITLHFLLLNLLFVLFWPLGLTSRIRSVTKSRL